MKKLLGLLLCVAATSQATVNQLEFNLGRGTPESDLQAGGSSDHAGSRGTEWSADFLHQNGTRTYFGVGGGQFRSNDNVSETFVPNMSATLSSKSSSILLLTRFDIPSRSKMVPYVIAGIGWARNSLLITTMAGQQTLLQEYNDSLAYATGIGLDYPLTDRLFFGIEARYHGSVKRTFNLTPTGTAITGTTSVQTPLNIVTLGVKVGMKY